MCTQSWALRFGISGTFYTSYSYCNTRTNVSGGVRCALHTNNYEQPWWCGGFLHAIVYILHFPLCWLQKLTFWTAASPVFQHINTNTQIQFDLCIPRLAALIGCRCLLVKGGLAHFSSLLTNGCPQTRRTFLISSFPQRQTLNDACGRWTAWRLFVGVRQQAGPSERHEHGWSDWQVGASFTQTANLVWQITETVSFQLQLHNYNLVICHFCRFIQGTCATSGEGLYEGLNWLSANIKKTTASSWERVRTIFGRSPMILPSMS